MDNFCVGQYVRVNGHGEFDGMYGIVHDMVGEYIVIWAVRNPSEKCFVRCDEADEVLKKI